MEKRAFQCNKLSVAKCMKLFSSIWEASITPPQQKGHFPVFPFQVLYKKWSEKSESMNCLVALKIRLGAQALLKDWLCTLRMTSWFQLRHCRPFWSLNASWIQGPQPHLVNFQKIYLPLITTLQGCQYFPGTQLLTLEGLLNVSVNLLNFYTSILPCLFRSSTTSNSSSWQLSCTLPPPICTSIFVLTVFIP